MTNVNNEELDMYSEEARQRWGHTEAFKQSEERVKKMGKDGLNKVLAENGKLTEEIAECMRAGDEPTCDKVQELIERHYQGLRAFYEPNLEIYRGLAEMYTDDPRFKENYERVSPGLAEYMRRGMMHFADTREGGG